MIAGDMSWLEKAHPIYYTARKAPWGGDPSGPTLENPWMPAIQIHLAEVIMNEGCFYITTPIYYVNDVPHIGHAYTTCAADILARYFRLRGQRVLFLTGTDEHGQKIVKAAREAGLTPQELVDRVVVRFQELWKIMDISHDDFIRTTEERHIRTVQALFHNLSERGLVYKGEYEGWYCVPCETFWPENQLDERKVCPDCGRSLEKLKEDSYFFALSKFEKPLLEFFSSQPDFVMPESRYNEIMSFIQGGLKDQSISRVGLNWGVPVPGDPSHTFYVWFDALINYLSGVDYVDRGEKFSDFWPSVVHLVGKDILRFHSVLWPGMLVGAGIQPPQRVFAHGWWTIEGDKMSKSKGNVVDPYQVIDTYGADRFRYFMMREVTFGLDGDYSERALIERCNADLSDNFGNMVHRTLKMLDKYRGGKISRPVSYSDGEWESLLEEVIGKFEFSMNRFAFAQALEQVWRLAHAGNRYIDKKAPWKLAKLPDKQEELDTVLYRLLDCSRLLTLFVFPFIPRAAGKLWEMLGMEKLLEEHRIPEDLVWGKIQMFKPREAQPLFPRILDDEDR